MMRYEIEWLDKPAEVLECDGLRVLGGDGRDPLAYQFWRNAPSYWSETVNALIEPQETVLLVSPAAVKSIRPLEPAGVQQ